MKNFDGKLLSILAVWLLILLVVVLAGCTTITEPLPANASMLRCSEYSANTGAPFGSGRVDGCQCVQSGDLSGTIRIELENCEITLSP